MSSASKSEGEEKAQRGLRGRVSQAGRVRARLSASAGTRGHVPHLSTQVKLAPWRKTIPEG